MASENRRVTAAFLRELASAALLRHQRRTDAYETSDASAILANLIERVFRVRTTRLGEGQRKTWRFSLCLGEGQFPLVERKAGHAQAPSICQPRANKSCRLAVQFISTADHVSSRRTVEPLPPSGRRQREHHEARQSLLAGLAKNPPQPPPSTGRRAIASIASTGPGIPTMGTRAVVPVLPLSWREQNQRLH